MDRNVANKKETFIVKVEYYQNKTWQGQVVWAEQNRSVRFRSALELIKLLDEATTTGEMITAISEHSAS
jgi:hypothetical protein